MSSTHTPGPWRKVYVGCGDWDLTGPVTEADWKLAAAAPDLLAALISERHLRQLGQDPDVHWESLREARRTACATTDAAIAKATAP